MLFRTERAQGIFVRRVCAAHHFDDGGDLRVVFDDGKVVYHEIAERRVREVAKIENIFDFYRVARERGDFRLPLCEQVGDAASHHAEAENRNLCHKNLRAENAPSEARRESAARRYGHPTDKAYFC